MPAQHLRYIAAYPAAIQTRVADLLAQDKLGAMLVQRYPDAHAYASAGALYAFTQDLKSQYLRSSPPLSKVVYDDKLQVVEHALGMHSFVSRVQGNKLKAKKEMRIASLFRSAPEAFLRMIVVHELAHLREKPHNKAFYKLCEYMEPDYHRLELDLRIYLCQRERYGDLW
ncbi:MAG: metal-dependent hydrolase [Cellvibrionales bacterium]|nr:MAG: metal-dependent hydrolase [Cellvibrionales bacterium]